MITTPLAFKDYRMKLSEIIKSINANLNDETVAEKFTAQEPLGYSIDSRTIRAGDLFFAIKGENHDGHNFVAEVLQKGAIAAVINRDSGFRIQDSGLLIFVDDTLAALQTLANHLVTNWRGQLVAVTGSAGKTTTKDLIAAVLSEVGQVIKTQGNFNNAIGLPLSILKMESDGQHADDFDFGVFEMGMNHAGELAELTHIAPPDAVVITNVAAVHLEFFDSIDAIANAKAELVQGTKAGGAALLNMDDSRVARMRALRDDLRVRTYGIEQKADVMAKDIKSDGLSGTEFLLVTPGGEINTRLALVGKHNLYNALAAATVGDFYQVPLEKIAAAFAAITAPKMRGEVLRFAEGYTVIDDSYNSNPRALIEMVTTLCATQGYSRKIVVAGEMLELGERGAELHFEVGQKIAALGVDLLLGVRGLAEQLIEGARAAGMAATAARFFATPAEAGEFLATQARASDLILVKGSRGVKTEVVVERMKKRSQESEAGSQNKTKYEV
ncbi:MAG: UDP-N-acetylmuramoyl-tripeptide--D-alanyl-D-alanine ligase [Acidobacteriota bacterium]